MSAYFDSYDPSGYLAQQQNQALQPPANSAVKGPNWLSLLPSATATAASFIPGVGTIAAAGLGAGGELAREKLAGENVDLAKVGTEGLLSAVPFGLGKIGKVAKLGIDAAKSVNVTTKGLQLAGDAAKAVDATAPVASTALANAAPGLLQRIQNIGGDLSATARGITPGVTAKGQDQLGVQDANSLNDFLNNVGVKGKNATDQLGHLEQLHTGWANQLKDVVAKNNAPLAASDLSAVKDAIAAKVGDLAGLPKTAPEVALVGADGKALVTTGGDVANHPYIGDLYGDLSKVHDREGLNNLRQKIDDTINFSRNSATPDPQKEQIATAFRRGISDYMGTAVPDMKPIQGLLSNSYDAQSFLKNAAKNPQGAKILGFNVGGDALQTAKAKAGAALDGSAPTAPVDGATSPPGLLGKVVNGVKTTAKTAGTFGAQELTRAVASATGVTDAANGVIPAFNADSVPAPGSDSTAKDELAAANAQILPGGAKDSSGASGVTDAELLAMQRQALSNPDAKSQAAQLAIISTLIDQRGKLTPKGAKPLSTAANQQLGNATSGLNAISQLQSELAKNPGAANTNAASSLLGNFGRGVAGTQGYNAANQEIIDVLSRLRTGAAISASEEALYKSQLPTAFDTPATIAQKLQRYQSLFQGIADRAQGGSPALEAAGVTQN